MSEVEQRPPDRKKQKTKADAEPPMDDETLMDEETEKPEPAHAAPETEPVAPVKRVQAGEDKSSAKKEKTGSAVPKPTAPEGHTAPSLAQRMRFRRPFKK